MFCIQSCRSGRSGIEPKEVVINVPFKIASIKDSLLKSGIDTLFIYSKTCSGCYNVPVMGKKNKKKHRIYSKNYHYVSYSVMSYAEPVYIFWTKNGDYFVKRIDEFAEYEPVKRWEHLQYPLYDYFFQNDESLRQENYISGFRDTALVPIPDSRRKDTLIKRTSVEYYEEEHYFPPFNKPLSNTTRIEFYIPGEKYEKRISDDYFNPVATGKFEKEFRKVFNENHPGDSLIIGNNKDNYMLNRSMKIYTWKLMIESELFEIEMRDLWKPVER
jgi:hypothetical protein